MWSSVSIHNWIYLLVESRNTDDSSANDCPRRVSTDRFAMDRLLCRMLSMISVVWHSYKVWITIPLVSVSKDASGGLTSLNDRSVMRQ